MVKYHKRLRIVLFLLVVINIMGAACTTTGPSSPVATSLTENIEIPSSSPSRSNPTLTATNAQTIQPSMTPSRTSTVSVVSSPSVTSSHTATQVITPSSTPTYAILRGTVLEQSNCRYGPGAAYLYKYGLYSDNNLEVIGRNETGSWIVVQAIGGSNPCWIKASLMDIRGDVNSLAPVSLPLPQSPYYGPVTGIASIRNGDTVTISWDPIYLRAGDDSFQYPYLIEAWLCKDAVLTFEAIGSWETIVTVTDEPGCTDLSHARVYGVEKHGYTNWVTVPWVQP